VQAEGICTQEQHRGSTLDQKCCPRTPTATQTRWDQYILHIISPPPTCADAVLGRPSLELGPLFSSLPESWVARDGF
jgi:hypothetical protein